MQIPFQHFAMLSMLTRPTGIRKILLGESEAAAKENLRKVQKEKGPFDYDEFDRVFKRDIHKYLQQNGFEDVNQAYADLLIMFHEVLKNHGTIFALQSTLNQIDEEYSGTGEHPGEGDQKLIFANMRSMDKLVASGATIERQQNLRKLPS